MIQYNIIYQIILDPEETNTITAHLRKLRPRDVKCLMQNQSFFFLSVTDKFLKLKFISLFSPQNH